ncbi:hypothetical protein ACTFIW_010054 [Dictyostelium discoideum]
MDQEDHIDGSIFEKTLKLVEENKNKYNYTTTNGSFFNLINEKNNQYEITTETGKLKCNCKAFTINHIYHGRYCKHIIFILITHYNVKGKALEEHWLNNTIPGVKSVETQIQQTKKRVYTNSTNKKEIEKDISTNVKKPLIEIDESDNNLKGLIEKSKDCEEEKKRLTNDNEWISNFLINMYLLGVLNHKEKGVQFLPCAYSNEELTLSEKIESGIKLSECKKIIIPYLKMVKVGGNMAGNHWILFVIEKVNDSNKTKVRFIVEEYDKEKIKDNFQAQNNGWDCGVYLCMFSKFIANGLKINSNNINRERVANFRKQILNELIEQGCDKLNIYSFTSLDYSDLK